MMQTVRRLCLAMIAWALAAAFAAPGFAAAPPRSADYIVVYASSARPLSVTRDTHRLEQAYGFRSWMRFRHALKGFAASLTEEQAARLRRDPKVAITERDQRVSVAGRVPVAAGETVPTGVARIAAATAGTVHEASDAAVAVIDSGIDLDHPDLNAAAGTDCTGAGSSEDAFGHGTFVAGVIGARNDGAGVVGVAPGTKLYAVRVLQGGSGPLSQVICGIDWVTANAGGLGIKVANLSLTSAGAAGSSCSSDAFHLAICNSVSAGVNYVVAAGNSGASFDGSMSYTPAEFPEVLTVTGVSDSDGAPGALGGAPACQSDQSDDSYWTFSNYASSAAATNHVVAAPAACIGSTYLGGGYTTASGTSAAAPHVAGVVALCIGEGGATGACTGMTPPEVIAQIRADAAANATLANGFAGDPNHPVGPYFGYLASGLDPAVRRIANVVVQPSSPQPPPPAPPDNSIDLSLRVRRVQDVASLHVLAWTGEPGSAKASASVTLRRNRGSRPAAARLIRFRRDVRALFADRRTRLRLRLGRRHLRAVRRALRRGAHLTARVTVSATDRAGNATTKGRGVRLTAKRGRSR